MYLSLHNNGVCITLPVACNDHPITLVWDEWSNGKGYNLAGAYCETCSGTYYPVNNEFMTPYFIMSSTFRNPLCDDMGGY